MPKSTKDVLGNYPVMRAPTRKEDPYAAEEQEWINSLPTDRMGNKVPVMRAPTWKEKVNDFVRNAYEAVAEQPLAKLADAFGFTEFDQLANPKPRPKNIDEVQVQGRSPGELIDAPVAKASLIPAKFIMPMAERLRKNIAGKIPFEDVVSDQILRNPGVAAHISNIRPQPKTLYNINTLGSYTPPDKTNAEIRKFLQSQNQDELFQSFVEGENESLLNSMFGHLQLNPDAKDPSGLVRHEFNHAAQAISGKLNPLMKMFHSKDYTSRPYEIGSRVSEARGKHLGEAGINKTPGAIARKYYDLAPSNKTTAPFNAVESFLDELNKFAYVEHYKSGNEVGDFNDAVRFMNDELTKRGRGINQKVTYPEFNPDFRIQDPPERKFELVNEPTRIDVAPVQPDFQLGYRKIGNLTEPVDFSIPKDMDFIDRSQIELPFPDPNYPTLPFEPEFQDKVLRTRGYLKRNNIPYRDTSRFDPKR